MWSKCDLKSSSSSSSLLWLFPFAPRSQVSVQLPCVKVLIHPSYQSYWIALCSGMAFYLIYGHVSVHSTFFSIRKLPAIVYSDLGSTNTSVPNSKCPHNTSESNSWNCRCFIYICDPHQSKYVKAVVRDVLKTDIRNPRNHSLHRVWAQLRAWIRICFFPSF